MNPAIQTDNLTFAYKDKPVLDGVSLSIESGEMVGILGPNGSGKTTLLKIFSAVLRGRGEVKVNGRSIETYGKRELSRLFAMVPQESQILFPYTVAEIVLMGRASYHSPLALEGKKDLEVARASMELTDSLSVLRPLSPRVERRRKAASDHRPGLGPGTADSLAGRAFRLPRSQASSPSLRAHAPAQPRAQPDHRRRAPRSQPRRAFLSAPSDAARRKSLSRRDTQGCTNRRDNRRGLRCSR